MFNKYRLRDQVTEMTGKRLQRIFLFIGATVVLVVILGVWVSHQFPALTNGPKSSAEMLEALFKTPIRTVTASTDYVLKHIEQEAVKLFVKSCDLPPETEKRLLEMVSGEDFSEVTVPFVFYLYELYGAPGTTEAVATNDLTYDEETIARCQEARRTCAATLRRPVPPGEAGGGRERPAPARALR